MLCVYLELVVSLGSFLRDEFRFLILLNAKIHSQSLDQYFKVPIGLPDPYTAHWKMTANPIWQERAEYKSSKDKASIKFIPIRSNLLKNKLFRLSGNHRLRQCSNQSINDLDYVE